MIVILVVFAVLAAGCVMADELLPRIGPAELFIRQLPLGKEEER